MTWRRRLGFVLIAVLIAAAIYTGLQIYLRQMVKRHLQTTVQTTPALEDIQYAGLAVQLLPFGIALEQVTLKPSGSADPIPIDHVYLDRFEPGRGLPARLELRLDGVLVHRTHPIAEPVRDLMQRLALKNLELNLHIRLANDDAPAGQWRGRAELKIRQTGILRIALAIENLDAEGVLRAIDNPVSWMAVLPPTGIQTMGLEFEDRGLVDRVVVDRARRSGTPPDLARRQIRQEIETMAHRQKIPALGRVLSEFVADPVRIGYYTGNTQPVYLGRLLWSRRIRDWLHPFQIRGYRVSTPRESPWMASGAATPGQPPRL